MTKENFIKYIESLIKIAEIQNKMLGTGIEFIDYNEHFFKALNYLEKSIFRKITIDLINDYVWSHRPINIYKKETGEIIFVIDSPTKLWQYIEENDGLAKEGCYNCDGSGVVDSGGFTPWGTPISVQCPVCLQ